MAQMDFTGRWRTRGGYIADVDGCTDGVWFGLVDGNSTRWDGKGDCAGHPEYDLISRIPHPEASREAKNTSGRR